MEPYVKAIGVLVDDLTSIIKAVVLHAFDLSTLQPGESYKTVLWFRDNPYNPSTLIGRRWLPDGTTEEVPVTWDQFRMQRDVALSATDWTQVGDSPLSSEKVQEYAVWRQQLRDLPQQYATPEEAMAALEILLNNKP